MSDKPKSLPELQSLGEELRKKLDAGVNKEWDTLERPFPVASLYANQPKRDKLSLRNHAFESMVSAYYGLVISNWIQPYLDLHEKLTALEKTSQHSAFEFANDTRIWACADRAVQEELPSMRELLGGTKGDDEDDEDDKPSFTPVRVKAMALQTQSRNFLIVLCERYGRWQLHFRRFWEDVREIEPGQYCPVRSAFKARKSQMTLLDVIEMADQAAETYGDAYPGVSQPKRPLLSTYLDGSLIAKNTDAGIGLRYGDFRDRGYVMSFIPDRDLPEVDTALACDFGEVDYVAANLASAICVLEEEF